MQFKKQIIVFFAFLVFFTSSGLAFTIHYCGQNIASISSVFSNNETCEIPKEEEKSCCAEKLETQKKCCSDKEIVIKDSIEKNTFKNGISLEFLKIDFPQFTVNFNTNSTLNKTSQHLSFYCDANAPPLYNLYCQYTFYG